MSKEQASFDFPKTGNLYGTMDRIIGHWTGGGGRANDTDKKAYNRLVEFDGTIVAGKHSIEDNIVTADGDYAAHTLNLNTRSIGYAMCGMRDATEVPLNFGSSPLTEKQFHSFCILVAETALSYGIPVTDKTILFHSEVENNLGVKQRNKWDVNHLKWRPDLVGAKAVGDYMRDLVRGYMKTISGSSDSFEDITDAVTERTIFYGEQSEEVKTWQKELIRHGYTLGRVDGIFGKNMRKALLAFQADHGLVTDAKLGKKTKTALRKSTTVSHVRDVDVADLRKAGSEEVKIGDYAKILGAGGIVGSAVNGIAESAETASGVIDTVTNLVTQHTMTLVYMAVFAGVFYFGRKLINRRVQKAKYSQDVSL